MQKVIQFKEEMLVDLFLSAGDSVSFAFQEPRSTLIEIRAEPAKQAGQRATAICTARLEWKASERVRLDFETLAKGNLPEGSTLPPSHAGMVDSKGKIKNGYPVPPSALPERMRSAFGQATTELRDYAARTIKTIRWRTNQQAGHNPIPATRGSFFSMDGTKWIRLQNLTFEAEVYVSLSLPVETRNEIETIVRTGGDEPLGHERHREALSHRVQNPRSSLMIAIAAAKISFKELVGDLVPAARWIIDNAPSPPLVRMLTEYLPLLPVRCRVEGEIRLPPPRIMECLKRAVNMRNATTHTGRQVIESDTLKEILSSVKDVLWLLDYYRGSAWALDFIRPEIRSTLLS